jgi:hypothetical protein
VGVGVNVRPRLVPRSPARQPTRVRTEGCLALALRVVLQIWSTPGHIRRNMGLGCPVRVRCDVIWAGIPSLARCRARS